MYVLYTYIHTCIHIYTYIKGGGYIYIYFFSIWLDYSPNGCKNEICVRPERVTKELHSSFPCGCWGPNIWAIFHCILRNISRKLDGNWSSKDSIWYANVASNCLTHSITIPASQAASKSTPTTCLPQKRQCRRHCH